MLPIYVFWYIYFSLINKFFLVDPVTEGVVREKVIGGFEVFPPYLYHVSLFTKCWVSIQKVPLFECSSMNDLKEIKKKYRTNKDVSDNERVN